MSWYRSRTDDELLALARDGDARARSWLVDRTLLPASRVARWLEPDTDAAVVALTVAYQATLRRLPSGPDDGSFLQSLLHHLDARAPFPLDPATSAALDPADRDRVRSAVVGRQHRRRTVPLAAILAAVAVAAAIVLVPDAAPVSVETDPSGSSADGSLEPAADASDPSDADDPSDTSDSATGVADDPSTTPSPSLSPSDDASADPTLESTDTSTTDDPTSSEQATELAETL